MNIENPELDIPVEDEGTYIISINELPVHHRRVRHILGGKPGDGLTVSRMCEDSCPGIGRDKDNKILCKYVDHYCLESESANQARTIEYYRRVG